MIMYGLSDTVITDICSVFRSFPNIDKVLIFGSRAKGTYSEGSDIDLAAVGENITFNQLDRKSTRLNSSHSE